MVPVPDPRLALALRSSPQKVIPTAVEFVDIAGLVAGAPQGEGLGNKFLAHIREVDAITHVVRCFENDDVIHVDNKIDPLADIETIDTELALADLESVDKALSAPNAAKPATRTQGAHRRAAKLRAALDREGRRARRIGRGQGAGARPVPAHPEAGDVRRERAGGRLREQSCTWTRCASALRGPRAPKRCRCRRPSRKSWSQLDDADQATPSRRPGPGRARPELRDPRRLQVAGPADLLHRRVKEACAWTVKPGSDRAAGGGVIHTDFEKGFIRAETIAYDDYIKYKGESGARDAGRLRLEGGIPGAGRRRAALPLQRLTKTVKLWS